MMEVVKRKKRRWEGLFHVVCAINDEGEREMEEKMGVVVGKKEVLDMSEVSVLHALPLILVAPISPESEAVERGL